MNFSSQLIKSAVEAFAMLPGIGKKTALRLVLHLVNQPAAVTEELASALLRMKHELRNCKVCHNVADSEVCEICRSISRDRSIVCVVESIRDVMAIEDTGQFRGVYHVLGGIIHPIEGVGPSELNIDSLVDRVEEGQIREVIMAISPTIEGDTTVFFISKKLAPYKLKLSTIARGVAFGGELEYTDDFTLGQSILSRIPYEYQDK